MRSTDSNTIAARNPIPVIAAATTAAPTTARTIFCLAVDGAIPLAAVPPPSAAYISPLEANRRLLDTLSVGGRRLEVVELPMPEPQYLEEQRLPASYANFYVANGVVVVPICGHSADRDMLAIIAEHYPGREVIGLDVGAVLAYGGGGIHCITQQQPSL